MKDSDIIKALRLCADRGCYRCTEYGKEYCRETIASLAWDLIYRQQAEIEELQHEIVSCNSEIEELRKEKDNLIKTYKECMTEAIKEFIAEFERRCIDGGIYPAFVKRQLEHVKEEMVGE